MAKIIAWQRYFSGGVVLIIAAIGFFVLLPQFNGFSQSFNLLSRADPLLIGLALLSSLAASVFTAAIYQSLSLRRLAWPATLLVELAGLFINRIVPAGIGGLGLNFLYLRAHKHTKTQAGLVVAANNLLGFVGHACITALVLGYYAVNHAVVTIRLPHISVQTLRISLAVAASLLITSIVYARHDSRRIRRLVTQLRTTLRQLLLRPYRLATALGLSMALTSANVLSLWLSCRSLGISISIIAVFLVFSLGVLAGTATPTPGGLGGIEAALVVGLVSQRVPLSAATAAVLLYRLVSFWFGLLIGALSTIIVRQKQLLTLGYR